MMKLFILLLLVLDLLELFIVLCWRLKTPIMLLPLVPQHHGKTRKKNIVKHVNDNISGNNIGVFVGFSPYDCDWSFSPLAINVAQDILKKLGISSTSTTTSTTTTTTSTTTTTTTATTSASPQPAGIPNLPIPKWDKLVTYTVYTKFEETDPIKIRAELAKYSPPLGFALTPSQMSVYSQVISDVAELSTFPPVLKANKNLPINLVAPVLNSLSVLAAYPGFARKTVNDPQTQFSAGTTQSAPAIPSQAFLDLGKENPGQKYVDFIDTSINVIHSVYKKDPKLMLTLSVLVSFMKGSKHYLAPCYNETGNSFAGIEFISMTNYFAAYDTVNNILDSFLNDQTTIYRSFWNLSTASLNNELVKKQYPKYHLFMKSFMKFNCLGYFSNEFTDKMFGPPPRKAQDS